ncbi:MAG TPA: hypothetical protein VFX51_24510 [Solirubrobacteraceae bacterium]|nr:hypothetical protein [Solirubrobacteraceae bacterium]
MASTVSTPCSDTRRSAPRAPAFRSRRLGAGLGVALTVCAAAVVASFVAAPAAAQTPPGPFAPPPVTIHSDGPLTTIVGSRRFQCQVTYQDAGQYFPPDSQFGQCGTYVALDGTLYGPAFGPSLSALTPPTPNTAWSQPGVVGTGTAADPYVNKTTTLLPGTQVYVRENHRYVTGDSFYRADVIVQNQGTTPISFRVYHGADCHLVAGGSFGLGYGLLRDDGGGLTTVACAENLANSPGGWVQSLVPLTAPNGYMQSYYLYPWTLMADTAPLSNTAATAVQWDPAMALSWDDSLAAGAQATYSYLAGFSPDGFIPPNPLTPEPLPPEDRPPANPEEPNPSPTPPSPSRPSRVTLAGIVFVRASARVAGINIRCRAVGSQRRRACIIETRRGDTRRTFILTSRGVARISLRLTDAQRARLRRDCETNTTFTAAVYQPAGRRARIVRKVVRVLCARLRRQVCDANSSVFTAGLDGQSTLSASRARERPRARAAC